MKAILTFIASCCGPCVAARRTARQPKRLPVGLRAAVIVLIALSVCCGSFCGRVTAQTIVTDTGAPAGSFAAPLSMPGLQPFWVGYVGADKGLGFQGQYFSVGGLVPLTTDMGSGVWFLDARGHVAVDNANFFSNIGFGRRAYFDPLDAIIGVSGWYDYDGDAYQNYGYRYNQLGVTGEIFNPVCDFRINGYFPLGNTAHVLNGFEQNYMLYVNGIDTAVHGGDAKFSLRPSWMAAMNGYIDIGGYIYKSSAVDTFGGVSTGFGIQPLPGLAVNMEVNHDDLFGTTGFIRLAFGLRGSPGNSRVGNRLLEPTRRNDHIVRFNQQPQIATNPDTNQFYHVIHVDNSAPAGGDGTVEHPFKTLAAGEAASNPFDVIYVHRGNGTTAGYNNGIVLQDNQTLLGSGNDYVMRATEVPYFLLHKLDSAQPMITNVAGNGITLANNDRVGGINVNAALIGIRGDFITNTTLEQNVIQNSGVDGIFLTSFAGTANINRNTISGSAEDGIHMFAGTATYSITNNVIYSNIRNGVFFEGTNGAAEVSGNTLGQNGRGNWAGLHVNSGTGTFNINVAHNTIQYNTEGIILEDNNLVGSILNASVHDNPQISWNLGDGIQIAARDGATVNVQVLNNPAISYNGRNTGGGAGLRLYSIDSTLNLLIANNTIDANAGYSSAIVIDQAAGIQGLFVGNSVTNINLVSNIIDGQGTPFNEFTPTGDGILLQYSTTNGVVQNLAMIGNQIVNSKGSGVLLTNSGGVGGTTGDLDVTLQNNIITHNYHTGLWVVQNGLGKTRVTATNNYFNNNVAFNSGGIGTFGADGGISLQSFGGNLTGVFSNNTISNNGQDGSAVGGAAVPVSGIAATTHLFGTMGLEILGNQINNNGDNAIHLEAFEGYANTPPATQGATLGALIDDNMMQKNHGANAVFAHTPLQAPPIGPNLSFIAVELTHNEASTPYLFQNDQINPDSALILYADGGLNLGAFNTGGLGTKQQVPVGTIDALVAPLLVFP